MNFIKRDYKVIIGGVDVTSRFYPRLLDLSIERAAGQATDSADIKLADPDGTTFMPSDRAPIDIYLAGHWAFTGFVTEVSCTLDKKGGREMNISAESADHGAKPKEPSLRHKDKATLATVAQEFGAKAGLSVQVLGSIASVEREYWLQQNESFLSWGQRMAREVGGTFKVIGNRAFLAARNEGLSASGQPLTPIAATVGVNLLECNVTPIVSRPKYKNVKLSYFDIAKGEKVEVEMDTGITDVDVILRSTLAVANKDQAEQKAKSLSKESDREKGQGSVTIIGDARAEPEALCILSGMRPGADGAYRIDAVSHRLDKGSGFTTTLQLRQPQQGAGTDSRGSKTASAGGALTAPNNLALDTTAVDPNSNIA